MAATIWIIGVIFFISSLCSIFVTYYHFSRQSKILDDYQEEIEDINEVMKDNKLIEFKSKTKDGNHNDYCNITTATNGEYNFDGTTEGKFFKYSSKKDFSLGTWWNHDVLINNNFVLGQSCRSTETKITFLNKEERQINNKKQIVQFFNVKGEDIDVKIGFTDNTFQWVSMDFSLKGEWNYQLKTLN